MQQLSSDPPRECNSENTIVPITVDLDAERIERFLSKMRYKSNLLTRIEISFTLNGRNYNILSDS